MGHSSTLTIAFLTPIIHGHSNVHFAILRYLLATPQADGRFLNIHIISDEPLRKRVADLPPSAHTSVTFHSTADTDSFAAVRSTGGSEILRTPPLSLFYKQGLSSLGEIIKLIMEEPQSYLPRHSAIAQVLQDIKPDLFVIDMLLHGLGLDAIHRAGTKVPYVTISPGPSLDMCGTAQPQGRGFWNYPCMFTTHTYPVPLLLIPLNILYGLLVILYFILHPRRRILDAARHAVGLPGSIMEASQDNSSQGFIHASLAEIEYPHIPRPRTIFVGPVLSPVAPMSQADYPDLAAFVEGGPGCTVYVNLGSLFSYSPADVRAVAEGYVAASQQLADRGGFRMLWKLPRSQDYRGILDEILGEKRTDVRIEDWVDAPALAVLQHPNVVLSVNHGGANSIIEAMYAGCPHLLLAAWYDLYTLSARAEWLGCGLQANKGVEPGISASLLADALVRALRVRDGEEGAQMRRRAEELGRICRERRGDQAAAEAILKATTARS